VVVVKDLTKKLGDKVIIDNLTFHIPKNSICGLIGQNGAGKTTLMRLLTGLIKADNGEIYIDNLTLEDNLTKIRSMIGFVPQKNALYMELSGIENLRYFGSVLSLKDKELDGAIDFVTKATDMGEHLNKLVKNYSGGMQKRLNIAIGLLGNPPLLLLDEPTVGVDPQTREMILDLLLGLKNEYQTTIIYTSHYLEEVEKICDRLVILDNGKLVANDTIENILHKSKTIEVVMKTPFESGEWSGMQKITIQYNEIALKLPLISQSMDMVGRINYGSGSLEQYLMGIKNGGSSC
jgi:ABC-2 type transport system ATP-binding protein